MSDRAHSDPPHTPDADVVLDAIENRDISPSSAALDGFDKTQTTRDPVIGFGDGTGRPGILGVVGDDTSPPVDNVKYGALFADSTPIGWLNFDSTGDVDIHQYDPDDGSFSSTPFMATPPDAGTQLGTVSMAARNVSWSAGWAGSEYTFGSRLTQQAQGYNGAGWEYLVQNLAPDGSATDKWRFAHEPSVEGRYLIQDRVNGGSYPFSIYPAGSPTAPDANTPVIFHNGAIVGLREVGAQPAEGDLVPREWAFTTDRDGSGTAAWLYRTSAGAAHYFDADGTL